MKIQNLTLLDHVGEPSEGARLQLQRLLLNQNQVVPPLSRSPSPTPPTTTTPPTSITTTSSTTLKSGKQRVQSRWSELADSLNDPYEGVIGIHAVGKLLLKLYGLFTKLAL